MADIEHKNIDAANLHPQVRYAQSTAPSSGMNALDLWFDTDDNVLYVYHSSAWKAIAPHPNRIPTFPNWASGEWYDTGYMINGADGNMELFADIVYAVPIYTPSDVTVNIAAIHTVFAGGAGEFARLGLYEAGTNGKPGARRVDFGTAGTNGSAGQKTITSLSHALPAGKYWAAMKPSVGMWVHGWGPSTVAPLGHTGLDVGGGYYALSASDSGTNLPDPFPSSPTRLAGGPRIGLHIS
jgi:hypothetical protein